jgi:hypothetical protein
MPYKVTNYTGGGTQLPVNLSLKAFGKTAQPALFVLSEARGTRIRGSDEGLWPYPQNGSNTLGLILIRTRGHWVL